MILSIITSNVNTSQPKNISFLGNSSRNNSNYKTYNTEVRDEFIKNIEHEKKSVITWANDRIEKLNNILDSIAKNEEMPTTDIIRIAAADFHTDRAAKVLDKLDKAGIPVKDIINEGPSSSGGLTGAQKNVLTNRVNDSYGLSGAQKKEFENEIRRCYYDDTEQSFSFGKREVTDPYTPDSSDTNITDEGAGDLCENGDSDCDSDCDCLDCLSDTSDCIS